VRSVSDPYDSLGLDLFFLQQEAKVHHGLTISASIAPVVFTGIPLAVSSLNRDIIDKNSSCSTAVRRLGSN